MLHRRPVLSSVAMTSLACGGLFASSSGIDRTIEACLVSSPEHVANMFIVGTVEARAVNPVCAACLTPVAMASQEMRAAMTAHALLESSCLCPSTCASEALNTVVSEEPGQRMTALGDICDAAEPEPLFTGPLAPLRSAAAPTDYAVVRLLLGALSDAQVGSIREPLAISLSLHGTGGLEPTSTPMVLGGPESLLTSLAAPLHECGESIGHRLVVSPEGTVAAVSGEETCVHDILMGVRLDPAPDWRVVDMTWEASVIPGAPDGDAPDIEDAPSPRQGPAPAPAPSKPKAGGRPPTVEGSLDRSVIQRVLKRQNGAVRSCYEQSLAKDPSIAGKLIVDLVIGPSGAVSEAKATQSVHPDVDACVVARLRTLVFPKPGNGKPVAVSLPFVFAPG